MALKNAYSRLNIQQIFNELQKSLSTHGAKQILFEYGDDGKIYGLTFVIKMEDRYLPIKLPANIEGVGRVLEEQGFRYDDEQIYRVAWRIVLDWVLAQMAFIESRQVKLEQIFLPYMTDRTGKTFFEKMKDTKFLLEDKR